MEGQSSQRVVLIHDTSGGVKTNAVRWILDGFKLKAGDIFTFLTVLHKTHHPMGYKIRVDNSMFGGTNQKIIDDEIARKKKEYDDNLELVQISKLYEMQKIDFKIEVVVGPIPKNAAVEASKKLNATWVILDRKMKKNKKYFLEKLSCGVSGLKRNEEIFKIRGTEDDEDLFSIEFDSSSYEQAPSIGYMVRNRGDSEIGSIDLSYDAPPSYNDVAPRDRSQTYEYSGVSELFERFYSHWRHQ